MGLADLQAANQIVLHFFGQRWLSRYLPYRISPSHTRNTFCLPWKYAVIGLNLLASTAINAWFLHSWYPASPRSSLLLPKFVWILCSSCRPQHPRIVKAENQYFGWDSFSVPRQGMLCLFHVGSIRTTCLEVYQVSKNKDFATKRLVLHPRKCSLPGRLLAMAQVSPLTLDGSIYLVSTPLWQSRMTLNA